MYSKIFQVFFSFFQLSTSVGFLLDSMFDFADRFNKLNLNDDELALFSAVVLLSPGKLVSLLLKHCK